MFRDRRLFGRSNRYTEFVKQQWGWHDLEKFGDGPQEHRIFGTLKRLWQPLRYVVADKLGR